MNARTEHQQDGTRRPPVDAPPHAWHEMERVIEHASHEPVVARYPQTGTRTPPSDVYPDIPEPPEEPPIHTSPAYSTRPPSREYGKKHDHPAAPEYDHGEHAGHDEGGHGQHPGAIPDVTAPVGTAPMVATAARQNQRNLTAAARAELHRRLRDYIASSADPVGYHYENGHVHGTPQFLPWHRRFLQGFERWQRTRLADPSAFIPLAFWDPSDPIPPEFPHPRRNASIPAMPPPASLAMNQLGSLDYPAFSSTLEAHHNAVHEAIGGDMRDPRVSPRDTCFWLFHAYMDNVFAEWETVRQGS